MVEIAKIGIGIVWIERLKMSNLRNRVSANRSIAIHQVHFLPVSQIEEFGTREMIVRQQSDRAIVGGEEGLSGGVVFFRNKDGRIRRLLLDSKREHIADKHAQDGRWISAPG